MQQIPLRIPKRKSRRIGRGSQNGFASYLSFGVYSTAFLAFFFVWYLLVLICILPMLGSMREGPPKRGVRFSGFEGAHLPRKEDVVHAAHTVKDKFGKIRKGFEHKDLLEDAITDFDNARAKKRKNVKENIKVMERDGFVVLGMHRSGTSMLSGLLVEGSGYHVGGPLIGAAEDNEKGFFERVDVVLQNDEFMKAQGIWWADRVAHYDADKALEDKKQNVAITFKEGERGLKFLNDKSKAPWLQKDPRMCITLRTWLPLLKTQPAVVFTYRHPLEVALSLKKREANFSLQRGLRLWIIYNMRAIQNSRDLCRVLTSNEKVLKDPLNEVQRISEELTAKCGIPGPPKQITKRVVDNFVDPGLQHNKKKREKELTTKKLLVRFGENCDVWDYESDFSDGTPQRDEEKKMYLAAMKIYCDFESGAAYQDKYDWPELP